MRKVNKVCMFVCMYVCMYVSGRLQEVKSNENFKTVS